jgi:hypothetical protein
VLIGLATGALLCGVLVATVPRRPGAAAGRGDHRAGAGRGAPDQRRGRAQGGG